MCTGGVIFSQDAKNIFTYKVGDCEVNLLVENRGQRDSAIILADKSVVQKYIPEGTSPAQTNIFLVKTPKNTILIDTGFGTTLFENLKSLKIEPAKIDIIFITHMHGDHISGLQKDGKPLFPNATVYLAEQEKNFWTDSKMMAAATEARQNNFKLAQNALAVYGKKVKTFKPADLNSKLKELVPRITPIAAFGHTPGHTLYLVSSGKESLLITGDLINVMEIQIPVPEIATVYDTDPKAASETRKKVFEYVTKNKIPIAGMHLLYPSIGTLEEPNKGEYKFNPAKH